MIYLQYNGRGVGGCRVGEVFRVCMGMCRDVGYLTIFYYLSFLRVETIHTHTNLMRKIKWPSAIIRLTVHCMCGLMSGPVIYASIENKYGHT